MTVPPTPPFPDFTFGMPVAKGASSDQDHPASLPELAVALEGHDRGQRHAARSSAFAGTWIPSLP